MSTFDAMYRSGRKTHPFQLQAAVDPSKLKVSERFSATVVAASSDYQHLVGQEHTFHVEVALSAGSNQPLHIAH